MEEEIKKPTSDFI